MRLSPRPACLLLSILLSTSCGASGDAESPEPQDPRSAETTFASTTNPKGPTTSVTATPQTTTGAPVTADLPDPIPLRLSFDGTACSFEGQSEFDSGMVELTYVNQSEGEAWIALNRHTGDESVADAVAHFGESPSSIPCPSWKADVVRTAVEPGDEFTWNGHLQPGTYHMVCYGYPPLSVWFGAGLTVGT